MASNGIDQLIGRTITEITGDMGGKGYPPDQLTFHFEDGMPLVMRCLASKAEVREIRGDLSVIVDTPIISAKRKNTFWHGDSHFTIKSALGEVEIVWTKGDVGLWIY